jgi:hypothetical protein
MVEENTYTVSRLEPSSSTIFSMIKIIGEIIVEKIEPLLALFVSASPPVLALMVALAAIGAVAFAIYVVHCAVHRGE